MPPTSPAVPTNPQVTSITACFPCYNDARTIGQLVADAFATLDPLVPDVQVVVANDGSSDDSREVLDRLAADEPRLTVVHHDRNRGYGGALISAFGAATKEWIVYTDGDAQYDATEFADLVAVVTPGTDIVQGWKISRGDPWHRKLIGRTYHHTVKALFGLQVRDTDCDFRLFRRSLLTRAPLTRTSGVICVEMMRKFQTVGAGFIEVPVHHYPRPHGRSQFFRLPAVSRSAYQLGRLWVRLMVIDRTRPR